MSKSKDNSELSERLVDLEMRIAFQEDLIQSLSTQATEQSRDIVKLERMVSHVSQKLRQVLDQRGGSGTLDHQDEPPPPHY